MKKSLLLASVSWPDKYRRTEPSRLRGGVNNFRVIYKSKCLITISSRQQKLNRIKVQNIMQHLIDIENCLSCQCQPLSNDHHQASLSTAPKSRRRQDDLHQHDAPSRVLIGTQTDYLRLDTTTAVEPQRGPKAVGKKTYKWIDHISFDGKSEHFGKENNRPYLQASYRSPQASFRLPQASFRSPQVSYNQLPHCRSPRNTHKVSREDNRVSFQPSANGFTRVDRPSRPLYRPIAVFPPSPVQLSYQSSGDNSMLNSPRLRETARGQILAKAVPVQLEVRRRVAHKPNEEIQAQLRRQSSKDCSIAQIQYVQSRMVEDHEKLVSQPEGRILGQDGDLQAANVWKKMKDYKAVETETTTEEEGVPLKRGKKSICFADQSEQLGPGSDSSVRLSLTESQSPSSHQFATGGSFLKSNFDKGRVKTIEDILDYQEEPLPGRSCQRRYTSKQANKRLSQLQCRTIKTIKSVASDYESFLDINFMEKATERKHLLNLQ